MPMGGRGGEQSGGREGKWNGKQHTKQAATIKTLSRSSERIEHQCPQPPQSSISHDIFVVRTIFNNTFLNYRAKIKVSILCFIIVFRIETEPPTHPENIKCLLIYNAPLGISQEQNLPQFYFYSICPRAKAGMECRFTSLPEVVTFQKEKHSYSGCITEHCFG